MSAPSLSDAALELPLRQQLRRALCKALHDAGRRDAFQEGICDSRQLMAMPEGGLPLEVVACKLHWIRSMHAVPRQVNGSDPLECSLYLLTVRERSAWQVLVGDSGGATWAACCALGCSWRASARRGARACLVEDERLQSVDRREAFAGEAVRRHCASRVL